MKQLVPFLVLGITISAIPLAFGASGNTAEPAVGASPVTVGSSAVTTSNTSVAPGGAITTASAPGTGGPVTVGPNGVTAASPTEPVALNAPSTVSPAAGSAFGEYKAVNCSTSTVFSTNSCDQCFDGGAVKPGTRITGLFDNWTNVSSNYLVAYKEEQKSPNMVKFGNSSWISTPTDESKIWKYSSDVQWVSASGSTGSGAKSSFMVNPGSKVKFYEADLGAWYTFEKTDKKNGEMIGMLRFPVVAHVMDMTTATEAAATTHYECVAYKLDAPAVAIAASGAATPAKTTPPKEATETQTGPETLLLIAAAFFIAFGMMFTLRRRV